MKISNRARNFDILSRHPLLKKLFKKLTDGDRDFCLKFISENESINDNEYEYKLNRLFLDKEKPRNWKIILELLSCSK